MPLMLSLAALLHAAFTAQAGAGLPDPVTSVAPPPPIVTAPGTPAARTRGANGARAYRRRAQPLAPLSSLISMDDYPAAALRANAEGVVDFRVAVGADGRVAGCVVTGSSGSASLDAATCRVVRSRARFEPAIDANGPADDVYVGRHRWRITHE